MKQLVVIAIVVIAAFVGVGYLTISGMTVSENAQELLQASAARLAALAAYDVTYNMTNSIRIGSESLSVSGTIRIVHAANGERISVAMQTYGTKAALDIYSIPEGTFRCSASLGGPTCERFNGTLPVQNPATEAALLQNLSDRGFVRVRSEESRTVIARRCNRIVSDYDITKLLAEASLPADMASGLKEMTASICFDAETGLPLDYVLSVRLEGEVSANSETRMTATRLELAAPEISLPQGATIY